MGISMRDSRLLPSMSLSVWRGFCIFLLVVVLLQFYMIVSETADATNLRRPSQNPLPLPKPTPPGTWRFDQERDSRNVGLTEAQCDHAFPDLYYEIDRAVSVWKKRGHTITQDDSDMSWRADGAVKVLIYDNELRILDVKGAWDYNPYRIRTTMVLLQLYRALLGATAAGEHLPNVEFALTVDDMANVPGRDDTHSIWAYTRLIDQEQSRLWLMPDFNFYSQPPVSNSYYDIQRQAKSQDSSVVDKIPKAVWRGAKAGNQVVRGNLLDATKGKDWADVMEVTPTQQTGRLRPEDACAYMFVLHTEGRSWSGRLSYLLTCDSVPIIHDLSWTAHFYHLLVPDGPDQNYVAVKRDFSDLEEKVKYYLNNPEEAQRIASNAVATFRSRYTTLAAETCYWRRLVRGWSEVAFEPDIYEAVSVNTSGTTVEQQQIRGTPIEGFIYIPNEKFTGD